MKNNFLVKPLPQVYNDLDLIEEYYLLEFSDTTAKKVRKSIMVSWRRLEMFPNSGMFTPNDKWNKKGYRMVLSGQYASLYFLEGDTVYIERVISTKTNYQEIFNEN